MISVVQMKLDDSYKIRHIDRSETIELIYKSKDGVLEEIKAGQNTLIGKKTIITK